MLRGLGSASKSFANEEFFSFILDIHHMLFLPVQKRKNYHLSTFSFGQVSLEEFSWDLPMNKHLASTINRICLNGFPCKEFDLLLNIHFHYKVIVLMIIYFLAKNTY